MVRVMAIPRSGLIAQEARSDRFERSCSASWPPDPLRVWSRSDEQALRASARARGSRTGSRSQAARDSSASGRRARSSAVEADRAFSRAKPLDRVWARALARSRAPKRRRRRQLLSALDARTRRAASEIRRASDRARLVARSAIVSRSRAAARSRSRARPTDSFVAVQKSVVARALLARSVYARATDAALGARLSLSRRGHAGRDVAGAATARAASRRSRATALAWAQTRRHAEPWRPRDRPRRAGAFWRCGRRGSPRARGADRAVLRGSGPLDLTPPSGGGAAVPKGGAKRRARSA